MAMLLGDLTYCTFLENIGKKWKQLQMLLDAIAGAAANRIQPQRLDISLRKPVCNLVSDINVERITIWNKLKGEYSLNEGSLEGLKMQIW